VQPAARVESIHVKPRLVSAVVTPVALIACVVAAQGDAPPRLPQPAGPFGVGRVSYDWIDNTRLETFSSNPQARRELMVYVWYPTDHKAAQGVYQPGAVQIDRAPGAERLRESPIWPSIVSGALKSHAQDKAPVLRGGTRLPVVLFSHGDTAANSFSYTSAIEDLASHGYAVVAVEHPYSSSAVAFADGRVIFAQSRERLRGDRPAGIPYFEGVEIAMKEMRQIADIEAADLRFVLDRLEDIDRSHSSSPLFRRLDLSRIAAVGHSLGGMAAVRACQLEARLKACVNQDGGTADGVFLKYPDDGALRQPLLVIEATPPPTFTQQELQQRGITRAEWSANVAAIAAWRDRQLHEGAAGAYYVQLHATGINHMSFGDAFLFASTPAARQQAIHNLRLAIDLTRAFLDDVLKKDGRTLFPQNIANTEVGVAVFPPHQP